MYEELVQENMNIEEQIEIVIEEYNKSIEEYIIVEQEQTIEQYEEKQIIEQQEIEIVQEIEFIEQQIEEKLQIEEYNIIIEEQEQFISIIEEELEQIIYSQEEQIIEEQINMYEELIEHQLQIAEEMIEETLIVEIELIQEQTNEIEVEENKQIKLQIEYEEELIIESQQEILLEQIIEYQEEYQVEIELLVEIETNISIEIEEYYKQEIEFEEITEIIPINCGIMYKKLIDNKFICKSSYDCQLYTKIINDYYVCETSINCQQSVYFTRNKLYSTKKEKFLDQLYQNYTIYTCVQDCTNKLFINSINSKECYDVCPVFGMNYKICYNLNQVSSNNLASCPLSKRYYFGDQCYSETDCIPKKNLMSDNTYMCYQIYPYSCKSKKYLQLSTYTCQSINTEVKYYEDTTQSKIETLCQYGVVLQQNCIVPIKCPFINSMQYVWQDGGCYDIDQCLINEKVMSYIDSIGHCIYQPSSSDRWIII